MKGIINTYKAGRFSVRFLYSKLLNQLEIEKGFNFKLNNDSKRNLRKLFPN